MDFTNEPITIVDESGAEKEVSLIFSYTDEETGREYMLFGDDGEEGTFIKNTGAVVQYKYEPGHMTSEIIGAAERMREIFPGQRILTYIIPGFTNQAAYNGRNETAIKMINSAFIGQRNTGGFAKYGDTQVECLNKIGEINFDSINSMMVTANDDYRTRWFDYVDNAINYNGWAVYCFHNIWEVETGVGHNVAQSKASELFTYIAEKVESGELWNATLDQATMYTKEYQSASVTITNDGKTIEVRLHDKLDNKIYDMPLTVKVEVPSKWKTASFDYNDEHYKIPVEKDSSGKTYILVDLIPDTGTAKIAKVD